MKLRDFLPRTTRKIARTDPIILSYFQTGKRRKRLGKRLKGMIIRKNPIKKEKIMVKKEKSALQNASSARNLKKNKPAKSLSLPQSGDCAEYGFLPGS